MSKLNNTCFLSLSKNNKGKSSKMRKNIINDNKITFLMSWECCLTMAIS